MRGAVQRGLHCRNDHQRSLDINIQPNWPTIEIYHIFCVPQQDLDPEVRWSPQQALRHPFLTGERFTGPFQPPPQPHMRARPAPPPPRPDGQAALSPYNSALYQSPVAAILATSPEFHAQAHAAAMAAVQVRAIDVLNICFQCLCPSSLLGPHCAFV